MKVNFGIQDAIIDGNRIPVYGSMSRPANPGEGIREISRGKIPWDKGEIQIEFSTDELTAVCPSTGQPDYYQATIRYFPAEAYIESKTMKFYLWSFREFGIIPPEYLGRNKSNYDFILDYLNNRKVIYKKELTEN